MKNFTADSMVLKSKASTYYAAASFGNQALLAVADLPKTVHITTKLKTPIFLTLSSCFKSYLNSRNNSVKVSWQSYAQILS